MVSYVDQKVIKDLRDEVYEQILDNPLSFFNKYKVGNLISRVTNDINAVNVAINKNLTKIIRDPFVLIIFLKLLIDISWQLTILSMIIFPLTAFLITKIGHSLKRKSRRVQEKVADITSILQEAFTGVKIIKAFAMERYENKKNTNK